ncbi:MAG: hypothetical protein SFW36_10945, partial [Leptolyngbyaceae cyanobacterium bins.59]|nr:hypothetical protein [Leptolyngbyaceae cyanobacterium bins.59]
SEPTNVATQEVASNPDRYIGQTVTIRSEPIRKFGPNSFTAKDERVFGSEPILILNASGKPFALPTDEDTEVQITGEVRRFVVADVEKEYNLGLEANTYQEYENKPAIIARSVALSPKPGEITKNPEQYYGKTLAVAGEVKDVPSTTAFTLDEDQLFGAEDLLVLHTSPQATPPRPIQDGEKVAVTGVLRPFIVAEFERDYDLTWSLDLKQKLEAEYKNKPVLVATGVYPSAIPQSAQ